MQDDWQSDQLRKEAGSYFSEVEVRRLQKINADLLEALEKIMNCSHHKRAWEIAACAISKAKGE